MSSQWFVKRGDKARGPFAAERLKELAAEGKLKPTDEVREGDSGEWVEASRFDWLFPSEPVGEDDSADDEPPMPRKKRPAQSTGSPVEKAKALYQKNPQKAILLGGSILASVMLMGMCVCAGMFSLARSGGGKATGNSPTASDKQAEFAKGPNGEEIRVEEKKSVSIPKEQISYYTDKTGNRVLHGVSSTYAKDGTKTGETLHINGRPKRSSRWFSDGRPLMVQEPFDDEWNKETFYEYFPDGTERKTIRRLAKFKEFKMEKLEGGGTSRSEEWERINHGEMTMWFPNGQVYQALDYERGKLVSQVIFDQKGKIVFSKGK